MTREPDAMPSAASDPWALLKEARADNKRLRAALKPFAVPDKESLIDTLGHIGREEIAAARAALEPKP